ncbi:hypothetical protein MC885_001901 [Smutsia gigantea]|nr:hypothetical protein MC885_001901 [Smutsia gigantea]
MFSFGTAVAFTFDPCSFMAARLPLAVSASGYLVVVVVYVAELVGIESRTWASIHSHSFFATGTVVVALTGYLVRARRIYRVALCAVTVPFSLCCWMLQETPFWLLLEGRYEEAQAVVDTMASWDRAGSCKLLDLLPPKLEGPAGDKPSEAKKHTLLDLFHDRSSGTRTLTVWLVWFTGCLGFYWFSLGSVSLGGSEYLTLFLMGAVEIPAYVFVCVGMDSLGRRVLGFSLVSSAVSCGGISVIPKGYRIWTVAAAMAGKCSTGAAFGLIYLYTAELYPAIMRSLAMGSGSMVCRTGGIVAPFCVHLCSVWIFLLQVSVRREAATAPAMFRPLLTPPSVPRCLHTPSAGQVPPVSPDRAVVGLRGAQEEARGRGGEGPRRVCRV